MDYSLPGSSIHGIFQAKVLEWGAIAFSYDKPRQYIKKQRHCFADKCPSSQRYGFPSSDVWMWVGPEKKTEHQKNDAFVLWCWRILLRVPWTARRSNQSMLKEISTEYALEGLMLKLKLQHFGDLMWRANSLEKTLMLGKTENRRRKGWQRMSFSSGWHHGLNGHEFEQPQGDSEGQGIQACCNPWCCKVLDTIEQQKLFYYVWHRLEKEH